MKKPKRYDEFVLLNDMFNDMPDGAWLAALAEHGFADDRLFEMLEYEKQLNKKKVKEGKN